MSSNFIKLIGGAIFSIAVGIFFILRGVQEKEAFDKISGKIIYCDNNYLGISDKYINKQKYIKLDSNEDIYRVFIGKDFGDFKPDIDKVNQLLINDSVDIYVSDPIGTQKEIINRHVQFIYKENSPFYMKGSADRPLSLFMLFLGLLMIIMAFFLKKKGKI